MYKVTVKIQTKGKAKAEFKEFLIGEEGTAEYKSQMEAVADYLYDLDIPCDVDEDGDMFIDDILVAITDGDTFIEEFKIKSTAYSIIGQKE